MDKEYQEFENEFLSKLETTSIGLAIINNSGSLCYENFKNIDDKNDILTIATEAITRISQVVKKLDTKYPEFLILRGTKAFLILTSSLYKEHFYVIFGANSQSMGMTKICLQNTINTFEKRYSRVL